MTDRLRRNIVVPVVLAIAAAVVAVVLIAGAGTKKDRPNPDAASEPPKDSEMPLKSVMGKGTEITVVSEDGQSSYVVRAKESHAKVENGGLDYGTLKDVTGEVHMTYSYPAGFQTPNQANESIASTFKASVASVDRQKKTLVLGGGATITGEAQGLVLKATTVKYVQGLMRFEAEGNVTVTSDALHVGPLPKLWASKDLNKFGTPGMFK